MRWEMGDDLIPYEKGCFIIWIRKESTMIAMVYATNLLQRHYDGCIGVGRREISFELAKMR